MEETSAKSRTHLQSHETILVVSNQLDAIRVLTNLLSAQGYKVEETTNGQVLKTVETAKPDLVLLDVEALETGSHSEVDSYKVCQTLKSSAITQDISVIFLGTLDDLLDKRKAFAMGGADYITKPFQLEEVLLRVNQQLILYRQQQQLRAQNAALQQKIYECQQAEVKYHSMFENATEGIFQLTADGRYLNANPALARIYGYTSPGELITSITNIDQQLYVQPKRRDELAAYIRQYGYISEAESQVYRKDGSKIWIIENIRAVSDVNDTLLYYEGTVQDISDRHLMEMELRKHRHQTERLLVNVLPYKIAHQLKSNPGTIADSFDNVTVLFADLVEFTAASAQISATELVGLLNQIFSTFDQLAEQYGVEKIKTIGDAYMAAAGIPSPREDHAEAVARMALDMQQAIAQYMRKDGYPFQLRIGISTGSVVAGVIGIKKFAYDLWGDTVNVASRMESTGQPGRIQVSARAYEKLKDQFVLEDRGLVQVKGRGEIRTYWLQGVRSKEL